MNKNICLSTKFSTTKLLVRNKPNLCNKKSDKFESKLFLECENDGDQEGGLRTKGYFKTTFQDKPLISVVTVVFNGEEFIEETILSVLNQRYDNIEFIVIDGRSTDSTLQIIKKYEQEIDYWVSEKDKGLSNALNKAISLASGEYVAWQNADDLFTLNFFEEINHWLCERKYDCIYGDMNLIDSNSNVIKRLFFTPATLKDFAYVGNVLSNQAAVFKLDVFKRLGGLDESLKTSMDGELYFRMLAKNMKFKHIPKVYGAFRVHSTSITETFKNTSLSMNEWKYIRNKYNFDFNEHKEWRKQFIFYKFFYKIKKLIYIINKDNLKNLIFNQVKDSV